MHTGQIKTVKPNGYGFVHRDDGREDLYFHASSLRGLAFGDDLLWRRVRFDVEDSPRGPRAVNVQPA